MSRTIYITTPIYYVNGAPHIGHAYTTMAADSLKRWHRLVGDDAYLLTGTDEHGLKIAQAARKAGISPQEIADQNSKPFRDMSDRLGIDYDDFVRTTQDRHKAVVKALWNRMLAAGDIYESVYEGWYSVGDEAYFNEDELVDGKAPSGHTVEWVKEPSYFFKLSKYAAPLLAHMDQNPTFVQPKSRFNEVRSFIERGLNDISVSRANFDWGVPIPGVEGHVAYVWLDALTNYISALGGPEGEKFGQYWAPDDAFSVHLIGKDILRFHAIYWPAFLMSAGLPLPKQVFSHGWWTNGEEKMSKTAGNVVDPFDMADRFGADAFRYFLLREITFGTDGAFSEQGLTNRLNGDLANGFGNLVNRALGMLFRYRKGKVTGRGTANAAQDDALKAAHAAMLEAVPGRMGQLQFNKALEAIWGLVDAGNVYAHETEAWTLAKNGDDGRLDEVLYNLCEALRIIGIAVSPFIPGKAATLLDWLGVPADERTWGHIATWGGLASGTQIKKGKALFPRIDTKKKKKGQDAPQAAQKAAGGQKAQKSKGGGGKAKKAPAEPATPGIIEFGDFAKVELRVAKVIAAEPHPNADRLLKLTLEAGDPEPRTVCAGIASAYSPEDLIGKTVALVANLAPRKLRGVMSQGMLLAAGEGSNVKLMTVPGDIPPGTRIS